MLAARAQAWLAALGWEKKILLYAGVLSLFPVLVYSLGAAPDGPSVPRAPAADVTTLIPRGYVLVPVEVQNYEALDSILGRFGMVDLFQGGRLIARNVKILRAPQNPSQFAILVAEERTDEILKTGGPLTVIVKRNESAGTEFVKNEKPKRRKIVYEGD